MIYMYKCCETKINLKIPNAITLNGLKNILEEEFMNYDLTCQVWIDELKSGSLLSSSMTPCIAIAHTYHIEDYLQYVITVKEQGVSSFVQVYITENNTEMQRDKNGGTGQKSGKIFFIKRGHQGNFSDEHNYYDTLQTIITGIFENKL